MNVVLTSYLAQAGFPAGRQRRMVDGLRVLQDVARSGDRPVTYKVFAQRVQPGLASQASAQVLADIGQFCNAVEWPNVTCFVVSSATGECSEGFTRISTEDPAKARDAAWFQYSVYKTGPLVDED